MLSFSLPCKVVQIQSENIEDFLKRPIESPTVLSRNLKIKDQIYESSGSIKIGRGSDFDRCGKKIGKNQKGKKGAPKMPEKILLQIPEILDPKDDQTAYVSFPNHTMAPASKQKPIIIVPEIIIPTRKKRVIYHHNSIADSVRAMLNSPSHMAAFALKNPFYRKYATKQVLKRFKDYPYMDTYKVKTQKTKKMKSPLI